jgi:hypothetical protein
MTAGNKRLAGYVLNNIAVRFCMCFATLLLLSGCSSGYGTSFACGDSKGANCMPMDKVDRLIASGEIERYTKEKQETCRGSRCKKGESAEISKADELPALATPEIKFETIEVQG